MSLCSKIFSYCRSLIGHGNCYLCHQPSALLVCQFCQSSVLENDENQVCFYELTTPASEANLINHENITRHLVPPAYHQLFALGSYAYPLDKLIMDLKFGKKLYCLDILKTWFSIKLNQVYLKGIEAIIAVPLSPYRLISRQFNQAQEIANVLSANFHIPSIAPIKRVKSTKAQATLNREERFSNVQNAFLCDDMSRYQHIAIIDDVLTTGATINAVCDAIIKKHPEIQITVIVVALTHH